MGVPCLVMWHHFLFSHPCHKPPSYFLKIKPFLLPFIEVSVSLLKMYSLPDFFFFFPGTLGKNVGFPHTLGNVIFLISGSLRAEEGNIATLTYFA
jgi:hypothetical protein